MSVYISILILTSICCLCFGFLIGWIGYWYSEESEKHSQINQELNQYRSNQN